MDEDEHILREAMNSYQAGQMEGFEALYGALAPVLTQYLSALTRDAVRAADLLQETFLQLHRARATYDPRYPVRPWAFAIARNVYLTDQRSRRRRGAHEAPAQDLLPDLPIPPDVESLASRDQLGQALAQVGSERREALVLHHLLGFSFREIGNLLGIREAAAKLRASRGMADLRQVLHTEGGVHV